MKIRSQKSTFYYIGLFHTGKTGMVRISRVERQDYIRMTDSASQSGKIIYQTIDVIELNDIQDFSEQL